MRGFIILILFLSFQSGYYQVIKLDKVTKEELQEKQNPIDPSADATVLKRPKTSRQLG